jgi:hypothetical protein
MKLLNSNAYSTTLFYRLLLENCSLPLATVPSGAKFVVYFDVTCVTQRSLTQIVKSNNTIGDSCGAIRVLQVRCRLSPLVSCLSGLLYLVSTR